MITHLKTSPLCPARRFYSWPRALVNKIIMIKPSSFRRHPMPLEAVDSKGKEPYLASWRCREWTVTMVASNNKPKIVLIDLDLRSRRQVHKSIIPLIASSSRMLRAQKLASVSSISKLRRLWQRITLGITLSRLAKIVRLVSKRTVRLKHPTKCRLQKSRSNSRIIKQRSNNNCSSKSKHHKHKWPSSTRTHTVRPQ